MQKIAKIRCADEEMTYKTRVRLTQHRRQMPIMTERFKFICSALCTRNRATKILQKIIILKCASISKSKEKEDWYSLDDEHFSTSAEKLI